MTYMFMLVVGDWSKDGHEKTESYLYTSNYPLRDIKEAWNKTCIVLNTDVELSCYEHEDRALDEKDVEVLKANGIWVPEDPTFLSPSDFPELLLNLAKYTIRDLWWEIPQLETENIGGYGLFS